MPLTKKEREELEEIYKKNRDKIFTVRLIDRDIAMNLFKELCDGDRVLNYNEIVTVLLSLPIIEV